MGEPKPVASLSSSLLARKGHAKPAMRPQGFGGFSYSGGSEDLGWNDMGHDVIRPVQFRNGIETAEDDGDFEPPLPEVVRQQDVLAHEFGVDDFDDAEGADYDDEAVDYEEEDEGPAFDAPVLTTRRRIEDVLPVAQAPEVWATDDVEHASAEIAVEETVAEIMATAEPVEAVVEESKPLPSVAISRAKKAARGRKGKAAFTLRLDPERHLKLRLACAIERVSAQTIVTDALDRYLDALPEIGELASKVPAGRSKPN